MKYNSIGEQLIAKAKELDPSYKPDKFNDMSEAIDVILNNSGSGNDYIDIVLDFEQFATIWDQSTWDLTIPANTITEDMLSPILEGKKKGLLLKIKTEEEEGMNGFYTTIPFYCDFATGMLFTNVTNIFGLTGSWVGSIDKIDQDQVCKFNSLEGRVFYSPNIQDGKISQEEYDYISSLVKADKLAGITVDIAEITTFAFPLMGINYGNTFVFGSTSVGKETDVYTRKSIDYITYTIKPDLSCKLDWNSNYFVEISSSINERVIPTITQGHQENLSIGNGLKVENGVLKTNNIPELPSDASTKTYVLKSINGVLTWSE